MKFITNTICSKAQTKSLLEIADEMDRKEQAVKTASAEAKTVKTASAKPAKATKKATAKATKKATAKVAKKATAKVAKPVEAPVAKKAESKKLTLTRVAKLTDKDRGYLNKYFRKFYPADYVDALLESY
jgi:uncharacterized membrane-anchored protein